MPIIYEPKGRAAEYSHLAANIYSGCSHGCKYCYAPAVLRQSREQFNQPSQRKNLLAQVEKETPKYAGTDKRVLLCFTCDPYQHLNDAVGLTRQVMIRLQQQSIPFQVLTKGGGRAVPDFDLYSKRDAFATTLTFLDAARSAEDESQAATPDNRIAAIESAKQRGIETWVSLEPVIDPAESLAIIEQTADFVDHYKIGKLNHQATEITADDWRRFGIAAVELCEKLGKSYYVKDDLAALMPGVAIHNTDTRIAQAAPAGQSH